MSQPTAERATVWCMQHVLVYRGAGPANLSLGALVPVRVGALQPLHTLGALGALIALGADTIGAGVALRTALAVVDGDTLHAR